MKAFFRGSWQPLFDWLEAESRRSLHALVSASATLITISMWMLRHSHPSWILGPHPYPNGHSFALLFTAPFVAVVSLGYLLFPETRKPTATKLGPMSGYLQIQKAERRRKIIVAAGIIGALNYFLLVGTTG